MAIKINLTPYLKRGNQDQLDTISEKVVDRYLSKNGLGCFSRVKPSESRKTLTEVSKDLFDLVQQFKGNQEVAAMYSYKLLERVLKEHCKLTDDKDNPVELKKPKEITSDLLQNPSDPDATYSGHFRAVAVRLSRMMPVECLCEA